MNQIPKIHGLRALSYALRAPYPENLFAANSLASLCQLTHLEKTSFLARAIVEHGPEDKNQMREIFDAVMEAGGTMLDNYLVNLSAEKNQVAALTWLLKQEGIRPQGVSISWHLSPLADAIRNRRIEAATLLLEHGHSLVSFGVEGYRYDGCDGFHALAKKYAPTLVAPIAQRMARLQAIV